MNVIIDEEKQERAGVKMTDREVLLLIRLTQKTPVGKYLEMGFTPEERETILGWCDDYTVNNSPAQNPPPVLPSANHHALHWKYSDGSGSGVVPHLFTDAEKSLVSKVFDDVEPDKNVEWICLDKEEPNQKQNDCKKN